MPASARQGCMEGRPQAGGGGSEGLGGTRPGQDRRRVSWLWPQPRPVLRRGGGPRLSHSPPTLPVTQRCYRPSPVLVQPGYLRAPH